MNSYNSSQKVAEFLSHISQEKCIWRPFSATELVVKYAVKSSKSPLCGYQHAGLKPFVSVWKVCHLCILVLRNVVLEINRPSPWGP